MRRRRLNRKVQDEYSSSYDWCRYQQQDAEDRCGANLTQLSSPGLQKVVHRSMRVKAHDEIGCQIGDAVQIVESRPLSADKRWVVESILKRETKTADSGVEV